MNHCTVVPSCGQTHAFGNNRAAVLSLTVEKWRHCGETGDRGKPTKVCMQQHKVMWETLHLVYCKSFIASHVSLTVTCLDMWSHVVTDPIRTVSVSPQMSVSIYHCPVNSMVNELWNNDLIVTSSTMHSAVFLADIAKAANTVIYYWSSFKYDYTVLILIV